MLLGPKNLYPSQRALPERREGVRAERGLPNIEIVEDADDLDRLGKLRRTPLRTPDRTMHPRRMNPSSNANSWHCPIDSAKANGASVHSLRCRGVRMRALFASSKWKTVRAFSRFLRSCSDMSEEEMPSKAGISHPMRLYTKTCSKGRSARIRPSNAERFAIDRGTR